MKKKNCPKCGRPMRETAIFYESIMGKAIALRPVKVYVCTRRRCGHIESKIKIFKSALDKS